ncbi:hypothetical protein KC19_9G037500 [Ceratodon purpureus]|uniref:DUF7748 domain-containing protein n=1 Tax=Ceratodon purpureus TaxID=3225 RepID=A0A8T0GSH4_CERPU|nr:hypothetical protein KC19_9G037500 [Ceratodon purpureus]
MASTKITTVIDNRTGEVMILKVGNQNCFAELGTIGVGGEYKVEIDVNWTYQEFSLQPAKGRGLKKIIVSSDDCCDFERLTVTESGGEFQVDKVARGQSNSRVPSIINSWRRYFTWPKFNWRFWT